MKLSVDALNGYTGQYQVTNGPVLGVSRSEGKLQLTRMTSGTTMELGLLTPESKTRFFNEDEPRTTYVFSMDTEGKVQLQIENEGGKVIQTTSRLGSLLKSQAGMNSGTRSARLNAQADHGPTEITPTTLAQ